MLKYLEREVVKKAFCPNCKEDASAITKPPFPGWLIHYLYMNREKEIYQKDIETNFRMARSTVSHIVKQLEKDGFVTRIPGKKDTRLKQVCLTQKGEDTHVYVDHRIQETEKLIRQNIDPEDIEVFFKVSRQIVANIEGSQVAGESSCQASFHEIKE